MQEERSKVLEMVAVGTITVEQATQLLDAIGWGSQRPAERPRQEVEVVRSGASGRPRPPLVPGLTTEELVELSSHGVSGAYLKELRAAGIRDLSVDDVIELSSHGVSGAYLQELRSVGLADLSVEEVTELSSHGVSGSYIRELRDAGFNQLTIEELTELSSHGVRPGYIRELRDAGLGHLSVEEVTELSDHGVRAADVRPMQGAMQGAWVPAAGPERRARLATHLLALIGERTGRPLEMRDEQLDLEADLGLNSISRVEILGTFRRQLAERGELAELGDVDFDRLTALRTPQQILDVLAPAPGHGAPAAAGAGKSVEA